MKSHSNYVLSLFDFIDRSIIPKIKNPDVGRTGYSHVSMIKALLFKIIKDISSIPALIDKICSDLYLARAIGVVHIKDYASSESSFHYF